MFIKTPDGYINSAFITEFFLGYKEVLVFVVDRGTEIKFGPFDTPEDAQKFLDELVDKINRE